MRKVSIAFLSNNNIYTIDYSYCQQALASHKVVWRRVRMYSKRMVLRYIAKRSQDISKTSPTLWEYKGYLFLMFLLNESN